MFQDLRIINTITCNWRRRDENSRDNGESGGGMMRIN